MANLREFWDEMKDQDEVRSSEGGTACKIGAELRWRKWDLLVPTDNIIHGDWTLVKPKPGEIEEERWMRCEGGEHKEFLYESPSDPIRFRSKSGIENRKDFLYWGSEDLPWGVEWPRGYQVIWIHREDGDWTYYHKETGHTEQLVAGWAVMKAG